jgi:hypothetical protein
VSESAAGGRFSLLREAVRVLAEDAEWQIAWIGDAHPDELGLVFDDIYPAIPMMRDRDGVVFSPECLAALAAVDQSLTAMSGHANAELWTFEAVRCSEPWAALRAAAREVLAQLPPAPDPEP